MEVEKIIYLPSNLSYHTFYKMYLETIHLSQPEIPALFTKFDPVFKTSETLCFMSIHKGSKCFCDKSTILSNLPNSGESEVAELCANRQIANQGAVEIPEESQREQQLQLHKMDYRAYSATY